MGLFDNYREKFEQAQQEIIELKSANIALERQISELTAAKAALERENTDLEAKSKKLTELVGDDSAAIQSAKDLLSKLRRECVDLEVQRDATASKITELTTEMEALRNEYIVLDDAVLLQSFALYKPQYGFVTSEEYESVLRNNRERQETMVRHGDAAICERIWTVEGSEKKGKKFEDDNIKQILRSFNVECDDIIKKVKFSNYDASKKRIQKAYDTLNKLNAINKIRITDKYLELKLEELTLAFEFAKKRQEEKEELRRQRELHREELRLAKELEEKRAEIEKEQEHYNNALKRIDEQIAVEKNEERLSILQEKRQELEANLVDLDQALKEVDYREANQRAGYVYVISNIGAFGENIYKIGMTRRLEPQDRIDELGGASVPFRFDVHAMIFSDDAPGLEAALHRAFEDRKVNMVNGRKEFFRVTLEEIEAVVKQNHDATVEFIRLPEAEQYRESIKIREQQAKGQIDQLSL